MRRFLAISAVVLSSCALRPAAVAPVQVIVRAAPGADQGDAARLQALTEKAVRTRGVRAARVVMIDYFGGVTADSIAQTASQPRMSIFAEFTIADLQGRVLRHEYVRFPWTRGRLLLLRDTADLIAQRVTIGS